VSQRDEHGCCGEQSAEASPVDNPPGLPALRWRIGTQPTFFARMSARLTTQTLPDGPHAGSRPLRVLTARDTSDPTVALLDAFACTGDVLTFYHERIANECYLGTATERRSVLELARAIGYELDPGVAARAYLAFTLDDAPSSPLEVALPKGLPVMSIPGPDEVPQVFETEEPLTAHQSWNALEAARELPQRLQSPRRVVWLAGVGTGLRPGDRLLFINRDWSATPAAKPLPRLRDRLVRERPRIIEVRRPVRGVRGGLLAPRLEGALLEAAQPAPAAAAAKASVHALRRAASVDPLPALGVTRVELDAALSGLSDDAEDPIEVYVLRKSARLYGASAQPWAMLDPATRSRILEARDGEASYDDWPAIVDFESQDAGALDLEREVEGLAAGHRVVVLSPRLPADGHVDEVKALSVVSRDDLGFAATVSRLDLTGEIDEDDLDLRAMLVLFGAELLPTAGEPLEDEGLPRPVTGAELTSGLLLPVAAPPLAEGRKVHLTATTTDGEAEASFLLTIARIDPADGGLLRVRFEHPLPDDLLLDRTTLRLNANVALATHGETVEHEVLGSGDGRLPGQRFKLKKKGHTFVPDDSIEGRAPTLEVRVEGVRWQQVDALHGQAPAARVYTLRTQDDGSVQVGFGDGVRGARLPTGQENVVARYRAGIGLVGEVASRSLALLKKKPLGVRSVVNPEPAFGAEDPETRDAARAAAPASVRASSRVVSVRDYEDFALSYPGIGKASAVRLWDGRREIVHLTIGTASGGAVTRELEQQLKKALRLASDPTLRSIEVRGQELVWFASWLEVAAAAEPELVLQAVERKLEAAFAERAFAQPVLASELIALAHEVEGVVSVALRALVRLPADTSAAEREGQALADHAAAGERPAAPAPERLLAERARRDPSSVGVTQPAQLLLPHPIWGFILTEGVA
jgi:hypothetical protein